MSEATVVGEPVLPEAQMHLVLPIEPVTGRLVESYICTKGKSNSVVRHVSIDISGTPLARQLPRGSILWLHSARRRFLR